MIIRGQLMKNKIAILILTVILVFSCAFDVIYPPDEYSEEVTLDDAEKLVPEEFEPKEEETAEPVIEFSVPEEPVIPSWLGIDEDQMTILTAIYESMTGTGKAYSGWFAEGDHEPCTWQGVSCENGRVTGLAFKGVGYFKTFPEAVLELKDLKELRMVDTLMRGPLPDSFFGELQKLEVLELSGNYLTGEIPALPGAFAFYPMLREITISNNLDDDYDKIQMRNGPEYSDIAYYQPEEWEFPGIDLEPGLDGGLPEDWTRLPMLKKIDLSGNRLAGIIPDGYGELPLTELNIRSNDGPFTISKELSDLWLSRGVSVLADDLRVEGGYEEPTKPPYETPVSELTYEPIQEIPWEEPTPIPFFEIPTEEPTPVPFFEIPTEEPTAVPFFEIPTEEPTPVPWQMFPVTEPTDEYPHEFGPGRPIRTLEPFERATDHPRVRPTSVPTQVPPTPIIIVVTATPVPQWYTATPQTYYPPVYPYNPPPRPQDPPYPYYQQPGYYPTATPYTYSYPVWTYPTATSYTQYYTYPTATSYQPYYTYPTATAVPAQDPASQFGFTYKLAEMTSDTIPMTWRYTGMSEYSITYLNASGEVYPYYGMIWTPAADLCNSSVCNADVKNIPEELLKGGLFSLQLRARDASGNTYISEPVTMQVSMPEPTPVPTPQPQGSFLGGFFHWLFGPLIRLFGGK